MDRYTFDEADQWLIEEVIYELMQKYNLSKEKAFHLMDEYSNFLRLLHEMPEHVHHDSPRHWAKQIYEKADEMGAFKLYRKSSVLNVLSDDAITLRSPSNTFDLSKPLNVYLPHEKNNCVVFENGRWVIRSSSRSNETEVVEIYNDVPVVLRRVKKEKTYTHKT